MPTPGVAHPESKIAESSAGQYGRSVTLHHGGVRDFGVMFCLIMFRDDFFLVNPNAYTRRGASGLEHSRK